VNPVWVGLAALVAGFLVWFFGRQNHSRPVRHQAVEPTEFFAIKADGLRGGLAQMGLSEVFQYLNTVGASGSLVISSGRRKGHVEFARGRIVEAGFRRLAEMDALLAMLDLDCGDFHFEKAAHPAQIPDGIDVLDAIMVWMESRTERGVL